MILRHFNINQSLPCKIKDCFHKKQNGRYGLVSEIIIIDGVCDSFRNKYEYDRIGLYRR